jgi:AcrR family transcriptional regulator
MTAEPKLRERHRSQTRDLLIDAAVEVLRHSGFEEFSIDKVAARAGTSARTIYRYFADRDELIQAAGDRMDDALFPYSPPASADEIAEIFEPLFVSFDAEPRDEFRAVLAARVAGTMRWDGRNRRVRDIGEALEEVTCYLDPSEALRAKAVIVYLANSLAWLSLSDESSLDGKESGAAVAWAVKTLVNDLRARNRKARRQKGERRG